MSHGMLCDRDCGAREVEPDCADGYAHRWTEQGMGGCDQNPGVWSLAGTAFQVASRCLACGCQRIEVAYGSQRDPNQCDSVSYQDGAYRPEPAELTRQRKNRRRRNAAAAKRREAE